MNDEMWTCVMVQSHVGNFCLLTWFWLINLLDFCYLLDLSFVYLTFVTSFSNTLLTFVIYTCVPILHTIISSKLHFCLFSFCVPNGCRPLGLHFHWYISWYCVVDIFYIFLLLFLSTFHSPFLSIHLSLYQFTYLLYFLL